MALLLAAAGIVIYLDADRRAEVRARKADARDKLDDARRRLDAYREQRDATKGKEAEVGRMRKMTPCKMRSHSHRGYSITRGSARNSAR